MTSSFAALYGREPDAEWAAHGRVNIIGEFTDYNGGFVLPTALPMATHAALARREDGLVRVASLDVVGSGGTPEVVEARAGDLRPGSVGGWAAYAFGVVWALVEAGHRVCGADVLVRSEVPVGAGLSSSAALECAVGLALRGACELPIGLEELALLAQRAENDFVGVPCGVMDQMASLLCVPGEALLLDTRSLEHRAVPFALGPAGLALVVLDTRVRHELGASAYGERRRACEEAARRLGVDALRDVEPGGLDAALRRLDDPVLVRRVRHVVTESDRVLAATRALDGGRPEDLGPILTEGHRSLRDDFEVSCDELDTAVAAALDAGALGARMVGGGFGGSAIALVPSALVGPLAEAVRGAFSSAGFAAPRVFVAAGATKTPARP